MYEEQEKKESIKKEKKERRFFKEEKTKKEKIEKSKPKKEKIKKENNFVKKVKESFKKEKKVEKEPKEESKKIFTLKADYVSILIKLGIFLVIAFVIIFTVTKMKNGSQKNSFASNMEKMKEVAYTYYKVESHRPISISEEVSMTLGDMEEGSLIKELVDKKKNVCSKDYSYVSLTKKEEENYEMKVYLSCGGEAQSSTYDITYSKKKEENSEKEQTILYELKRNVTTNERYTCPEGYITSGSLCMKLNVTKTLPATPKYRIIPERNTSASYKKSKEEKEYADPIVEEKEERNCPTGSILQNGKCVKMTDPKYKNEKEYTCPTGATLSGTRCLFTTYPTETTKKAYCKEGTLIGDSCYITKKYTVKCLTGTKDSGKNACYVTYKAKEELSDWLFSGKVTYDEKKEVRDTETTSYEVDEYLENGKITYRKYIRKKVKVCDDDDILSGSTCRHYEEDYEQRTCSNGYLLTKDQKECYTYKDASYKKIEETYTCPKGYTKRGTKDSATCYKYEAATKTENKTPYCTSGYDLVDGKCIKEVESTNNTKSYTCPEGYTKIGTDEKTKCYKTTETEEYYYCRNKEATLEKDRCIVKEKTTFVGYSCPSGYNLSGSTCMKTDAKETIEATKKEGTTTSEETIWSKTKELSGWTWTGNTKIEE